MKKTLTAVIESADNNFCAYLKEVDGIIGVGKTVDETKRSLAESIEITKEECEADGIEIPEPIRGEYQMMYAYENGVCDT